MTVKKADGTAVTKTSLDKTAFTAEDPEFVINDTVYSHTEMPGQPGKLVKRKLFNQGQKVRQSEIDRAFPDAVISSITPATGPAAGGTTVTIHGTNLRGVSAVTFGGTAATAVTNVSETTATCVTPAKTAGTYNVVVTDDSGADTLTNGFVYT